MQQISREPLPAASNPEDTPIGIVALWRLLARNKLRIVLPAIVLSGLAVLLALRSDDIFVSEAQLLLTRGNLEIVEFDSAGDFAVTPGAVSNALTILSSRSVALQVIERLDLTNRPVINPEPAPGEAAAVYSDIELRQLALDWLGSAAQFTARPGSNVIAIRVTTTDPLLSADVANAYVDAYLNYQSRLAQNETERAAAALDARVRELRLQLEADQEALQSYRGTAQSVSPEQAAALAVEAASLRRRLTETEAELGAIETGLSALGDPAALEAAVENEETLARLAQSVLGAPFDPADAATAEPELRAALQAERTRLERLRAALRDGRDTIEARIEDATDYSVGLRQLEVEVETTSQVYESSLARLKELSIQTGLRDAGAQILAQAEPPLRSAAQGRRRMVAIAGVLGLFLGMAWALLREAANDRVRRPADIAEATGVDSVLQLPPAPKNKRLLSRRRRDHAPGSPFFEGVRMVRQQLLTMGRPASGPVLVGVFSGLPNEGKTTLTRALAQSFALIGRKVIVIDGDMRSGGLSAVMGVKRTAPGLQNVLAEDLDPEEAILSLEDAGFDLLPGGQAGRNAADILESTRFAELISHLQARYDVVIFDTPPILVVPDAHKIAGLMERHVFVAEYDRSPRAAVRSALANLRDAGAERPLVALCGVPGALGRQYGYSRGAYSQYYG